LFGPILRLVGIGKPKDIPIPNSLPGSEFIHLIQEPDPNAEAWNREAEAIAAIRGFVRQPYQIIDRRIRVLALTWEAGKIAFQKRGNDPKKWAKSRIGMFYAPKGGEGDAGIDGVIHLILQDISQPDRVRLALHEYGHAVWHWLLTAEEWLSWQSRNWSYEEFADDFARRMMGEKLDRDKSEYFDRLEKRLQETGSKAQRL
jgi:hypothetical protein